VIVAPGFGERGIEGKILSVCYSRKNNIPFFGICLGMQCAVIEYMRNILGKKDASTTEIDKTTSTPVIDLMHNQKQIREKGGSMRLGSYECKLVEDTIVSSSYNKKIINERHRHRYEFNNNFRELFFSKDMIMSGYNPKNNLVEIIELKNHPWFVGVQFHPEYKSTVQNPHPLFISFINSIIKNHEK
jgi:CTP synthase